MNKPIDPQEIISFALDYMVPAASQSLKDFYEAYVDGDDIGIETKADTTPASQADKQTERILRDLIEERFPDHGIIGEEFDNTNLDAELIWVLDPLDGTREFLAKKPGFFGSLIALLRNGLPVFGAVADPLYDKVWHSTQEISIDYFGAPVLSDLVVSCTGPDTMFPDPVQKKIIDHIRDTALEFRTGLNCNGFAQICDGHVDMAIETDLALHDIAALIPVLSNADVTIIDFDGNDYADYTFDIPQAIDRKYSIIASSNKKLAYEIQQQMQKKAA